MPTIFASLVESYVSKIKPPKKARQLYRDTKISGFAVEALAGGTITFYRLGRILGQVTRYKIGNYPENATDWAREECVKVNGLIAQGIDPRKKKKTEVKTLGALWDWYYAHCVKGKLSEGAKIKSLWDRYLLVWANLRLDEVDRAMCVELQTRIRTTIGRTPKKHKTGGPAAANHVLDLLRALYRTAHLNRWFDERDNPVRTVKKDRIRSRDRFIQPHEMVAFFKQLNECKPAMKDIFTIALFTGVRRSNVCEARKDHVDFEQAIWTIPWDQSKNRDPIRVRLIPQALEIFERRMAGDSPWFFPGKGAAGHIVDPSTSWENLLARAGLDDLRIHDLRRTIASYQAGAGASLHIIAESLSQNNIKTTPIYARLQDSVVRESVHKAALLILEASVEKKSKEVENGSADAAVTHG